VFEHTHCKKPITKHILFIVNDCTTEYYRKTSLSILSFATCSTRQEYCGNAEQDKKGYWRYRFRFSYQFQYCFFLQKMVLL
jgi:hypothetical protein